jgi:hypothetical protein
MLLFYTKHKVRAYRPSSAPTIVIRKARVRSLAVIAKVESTIKALFKPTIKPLLSSIVMNMSHRVMWQWFQRRESREFQMLGRWFSLNTSMLSSSVLLHSILRVPIALRLPQPGIGRTSMCPGPWRLFSSPGNAVANL